MKAAGKTEDLSAKRRSEAIEWLNSFSPDSKKPAKFSEDELRDRLFNGAVLACILNRISPGLVENPRSPCSSSDWAAYFKSFLSVMEEIGLPTFSIVDLQQGSMSSVVECLLSLKDYLDDEATENSRQERIKFINQISRRWKHSGDRSIVSRANSFREGPGHAFLREEGRNSLESISLRKFSSFSAAALINHPGHSFQECFHAKEGKFSHCSTTISELTKTNNLDNAPTKSLFRSIHGIIDQCMETKNEEKHEPSECMLRNILQELERRLSTQTEHIRNQNNLIKSREEKYQSRIKVLEALANNTSEETKIIMDQFQLIKIENSKIEEQKNLAEKEVFKLTEDKGNLESVISTLKQELKTSKEMYEHQCMKLESKSKETESLLDLKVKEMGFLLEDSRKKIRDLEQAFANKTAEETKIVKDQFQLIKIEMAKIENQKNLAEKNVFELTEDKENLKSVISTLKQELEKSREMYENQCIELEGKLKETESLLDTKVKEMGFLLEDSRKKIRDLKQALANNSEETKIIMDQFQLIKIEKSRIEDQKNLAEKDVFKLTEDKENLESVISTLKQELNTSREMYEHQCIELESKSRETESLLNVKIKEMGFQLEDSRKKIRDLEQALANNTAETKIIMDQFELIKIEKSKIEDQKNLAEKDVVKLTEDKENLESAISTLKQELKTSRELYEHQCVELESKSKETESLLNMKIKEMGLLLEDSRKKIRDLEQALESKCKDCSRKEDIFHSFADSKLLAVQELRNTSKSLKEEVLRNHKLCQNHLAELGSRIEQTLESKCKVCDRRENIFHNFADSKLLSVQELRTTSKSLKDEVLQTQVSWQNHLAELGLILKAVCDTKVSQNEAAKQEQLKSETTVDYDEKPVKVHEMDSELSEKHGDHISHHHESHSLLSLMHDTKLQDITDADSEERSSNVSDSSFSVGTETDSVNSGMDHDLDISQSGILKEKKSKFSSRIFKKFLKKNEDAAAGTGKLKSGDSLNSKSSKSGSIQATDSSAKASKSKN